MNTSLPRIFTDLAMSLEKGQIKSVSPQPPAKVSGTDSDGQRLVGVFVHPRDAKVALSQLREAGLPLSWMALMARDSFRHQWMPGLTVGDRFDSQWLGPSEGWHRVFSKYYRRGHYLLVVRGTRDAIRYAETLLSCRRGPSQIWRLQGGDSQCD